MADLSPEELEPTDSWVTAVSNSKGYQAMELVRDLTEQFQNSIGTRVEYKETASVELTSRRAHLTTAWTLVLSGNAKKERELVIADIGGGNGYMYDWCMEHQGLTYKYFGNSQVVKINWNVFESREIAIAYEFNKGDLPINFIENKESNYPEEIDFALLSCFIQYVDEWQEVINSMYAKSKYILLMRVPLVSSEGHREFVQHLYSEVYGKSQASWPIRLFSEKLFLDFILSKFQIIFTGEDSAETFPFEGKQYPMRTFFLVKKSLQITN